MKTFQITDSVSSTKVAKVAHGLMMMTWRANPVSDEQAFAAMLHSIQSLPPDTKVIFNSGEFYGTKPRTSNLELVSRFFEKYPQHADRVFLSVKGGTEADSLNPNSSESNIRRSVDTVLEKLRGKKKLDLFECARVDKNFKIVDTINVLARLVKEGKFDYIGMSECSADTLKAAHAIHPIAAVEIEVSPWSYENETKQVISVARELNIAVIGYSPLGRGFLTGTIKEKLESSGMMRTVHGIARSLIDVASECLDIRNHFPRFEEEAMKQNMKLVDALSEFANKKNISPAQLCIAWVSALGPHVIPLPGSSHEKRTEENAQAGNVELSKDEMAELDRIIVENEVQGDRYGSHGTAHLWG